MAKIRLSAGMGNAEQSNKTERSIIALFPTLAAELRQEVERRSVVAPALRHPSGTILEWDYQQASLFEDSTALIGAGALGREIAGIDGLRLWQPADRGFTWSLKTTRTRCETALSDWTPFTLFLDVDELLNETEREQAEKHCLTILKEISSQGPQAWVASCSPAAAG